MLDAFTGDAHVHYSIIEAIAAGEQTWSGITKRVGRSGGSLSAAAAVAGGDAGDRARGAGDGKDAPALQRVLYRIVDPYVAFWHRTVARLVNAGQPGAGSRRSACG